MKKAIYILFFVLILFLTSFYSVEKRKLLVNSLIGVKWENSDLEVIRFDSTFIFIPIKEEDYSTICQFNYHIQSDTIIVKNKTIKHFHLKVEYFDNDSIKLKPLNNDAKELLSGFNNLNFYNSKTIDRFFYYREKDISCSKQVNEAIKEIENENLVFCLHPRWPFRQEKEFIELLDQFGIKYKDLGPYPDFYRINRDCFCETMEYHIQKQFGDTFIDSLMKVADLLMIENKRLEFISYMKCDERPYSYIYGLKSGCYDMTAKVDLPVKSNRKEWKTPDGKENFVVYRPFMDIGFKYPQLPIIELKSVSLQ